MWYYHVEEGAMAVDRGVGVGDTSVPPPTHVL